MNIMVKLFGSTVSLFFTLILADFHCKIFDFAKVYTWQEGVLLLALNLYPYIIEGHYFGSFW